MWSDIKTLVIETSKASTENTQELVRRDASDTVDALVAGMRQLQDFRMAKLDAMYVSWDVLETRCSALEQKDDALIMRCDSTEIVPRDPAPFPTDWVGAAATIAGTSDTVQPPPHTFYIEDKVRLHDLNG